MSGGVNSLEPHVIQGDTDVFIKWLMRVFRSRQRTGIDGGSRKMVQFQMRNHKVSVGMGLDYGNNLGAVKGGKVEILLRVPRRIDQRYLIAVSYRIRRVRSPLVVKVVYIHVCDSYL